MIPHADVLCGYTTAPMLFCLIHVWNNIYLRKNKVSATIPAFTRQVNILVIFENEHSKHRVVKTWDDYIPYCQNHCGGQCSSPCTVCLLRVLMPQYGLSLMDLFGHASRLIFIRDQEHMWHVKSLKSEDILDHLLDLFCFLMSSFHMCMRTSMDHLYSCEGQPSLLTSVDHFFRWYTAIQKSQILTECAETTRNYMLNIEMPFIFKKNWMSIPCKKSIKHKEYNFELFLYMLLKSEIILMKIDQVIRIRFVSFRFMAYQPL